MTLIAGLVCVFVAMASIAVLLIDRWVGADLPWWWPGDSVEGQHEAD